MKISRSSRALLRAVSVVAGIVIMTGGVTFAALQSQQNVLTGNTIETATANLQLSTDGITYGNSHAGFDFNNLVPGGQPMPVTGYPVYLKNTGATPLALKLSVSSAPSNPAGVDLSKVNVLLTPTSGSPQSFTLQSLITANAAGGAAITAPSELFAGNTMHFTLQVSMATDAVTGASATLGNIDFAFSGLAVSN